MRRIRRLRDVMPRGLFGRTVLIILLPVLIAQALSTYIFFDRHWTRMTERLAYAVAGEIAAVSDQIEGSPRDHGTIEILKGLMAKHLDELVTFARGEKDPNLLTDAGTGPGLGDTLARALAAQVRRPFSVDVDMDHKNIDVVVQLKDGLLHVSMPQRRMYDSSGYIFVLWLNGLALIFFMIAIVFMRNQIRPIRRLAIAAERFGKGAHVQSFRPSGAREVRRATEAFFSMKDRITRAVQQRTAMLAGVSHDLRTPLTRMKLQLEMMPPSPDSDALRADIQDMEAMVEGYLAFMRGEGDEDARPADLVPLLERICANARRQGFAATLDAPQVLTLEIRAGALERALANIVDNARKYAHAAHMTLGADEDSGWVRLVIDDDGPGIPPERYDDVFKPFYRIESSRSQKTGGLGLGMAIAQDIILGHGGRIQLDRAPTGGLRVIIHLPL
ncbi:MAG: ATP-binding protein [Rhodospirillales bacterium]|nr:ATP-binding protein [Alphaproteobacteria bacterium]MCB9986141.1 ATP-binding protein [Rhodospirillales bacterium]USO07300.1 MAG: ATP-binding protein [Rhodospirillales bacterium]